jgi:hypothetical protein
MKWGAFAHKTQSYTYLTSFLSMGKTIQIIALLVLDQRRPNLVVACVSFAMLKHHYLILLQTYRCYHAMEK